MEHKLGKKYKLGITHKLGMGHQLGMGHKLGMDYFMKLYDWGKYLYAQAHLHPQSSDTS